MVWVKEYEVAMAVAPGRIVRAGSPLLSEERDKAMRIMVVARLFAVERPLSGIEVVTVIGQCAEIQPLDIAYAREQVMAGRIGAPRADGKVGVVMEVPPPKRQIAARAAPMLTRQFRAADLDAFR